MTHPGGRAPGAMLQGRVQVTPPGAGTDSPSAHNALAASMHTGRGAPSRNSTWKAARAEPLCSHCPPSNKGCRPAVPVTVLTRASSNAALSALPNAPAATAGAQPTFTTTTGMAAAWSAPTWVIRGCPPASRSSHAAETARASAGGWGTPPCMRPRPDACPCCTGAARRPDAAATSDIDCDLSLCRTDSRVALARVLHKGPQAAQLAGRVLQWPRPLSKLR